MMLRKHKMYELNLRRICPKIIIIHTWLLNLWFDMLLFAELFQKSLSAVYLPLQVNNNELPPVNYKASEVYVL